MWGLSGIDTFKCLITPQYMQKQPDIHTHITLNKDLERRQKGSQHYWLKI